MLVILPAEGLMLFPEKTIGFGRPKFALLATLKHSARNSTLVVSVIAVVLKTEKSNSARPGPSSHSTAHVSPGSQRGKAEGIRIEPLVQVAATSGRFFPSGSYGTEARNNSETAWTAGGTIRLPIRATLSAIFVSCRGVSSYDESTRITPIRLCEKA